MPGWMDRKTDDGARREIQLDRDTKGPHIVSLFEVTAENVRVEVGSFRYLRTPKGMPFHNICHTMLRIASYQLLSQMIPCMTIHGKPQVDRLADGGQVETDCTRVWRLPVTLTRPWPSTASLNGLRIVLRTTSVVKFQILNICLTAFSMWAQMQDRIHFFLNRSRRCHTSVSATAGGQIPEVF